MKRINLSILLIAIFSITLMTAHAQNAKETIANWAPNPKKVAEEVMSKYGEPDVSTSKMLVWYNNGPWKRTVLHVEEAPHKFPKPHTDMLQQFIDYRVPPAKFSEVAMYDGSVVAERTVGEMSARCDKEEMNFLALNLANDVATGKKTVQQARAYYTRAVKDFMKGKMDPYVQKFQFNVPKSGTGDPDKTTIKQ